MYKKGMRRAAALLAVCWLGLLFRAAAETPAEKLERLRAEQQAIEQQIEQNRTDAARAGDLVNLSRLSMLPCLNTSFRNISHSVVGS